MSYINKLLITFRLISSALFPESNPGKLPSAGNGTEIYTEAFSSVLANPERLLNPDNTLSLHFIGAAFPAAPFLLSRLKSCGFSGCRAIVTDKGLLVTGRR